MTSTGFSRKLENHAQLEEATPALTDSPYAQEVIAERVEQKTIIIASCGDWGCAGNI